MSHPQHGARGLLLWAASSPPPCSFPLRGHLRPLVCGGTVIAEVSESSTCGPVQPYVQGTTEHFPAESLARDFWPPAVGGTISFALSFSSLRDHLGPPVGGGAAIARVSESPECWLVAAPAGAVVDGGASAPSPDPMASPPKRPARRREIPMSDVAVSARDLLPAGHWVATDGNQKNKWRWRPTLGKQSGTC